jgi:hypothetical protein
MKKKQEEFNLRIIKKKLNNKTTYSIHEVQYDEILSCFEKKELAKKYEHLKNAFNSPVLSHEEIIKNGKSRD